MKLTVVIATHDRLALLRRTLRSLAEVRRPSGFDRVIVVENGSQTGAERICGEMRQSLPLEYLFVARAGLARARQHGLECAREGLVVFLDDDVRVSPNLLEAYATGAREHGPDAFYGGPLRIDYEHVPPPEWLLPHLPASVTGWDYSPDLPWFRGANFGVFVERALAIGGFNLSLGAGAFQPGSAGNPTGEEKDLQWRMLADGCRQIYLPTAVVWHYVPRDACTPAWALHRIYRYAVAQKMVEPDTFVGPRLFGAPRYMWRTLVTTGLRALAALAVRDPQRRFELQLPFHRHRGYVRGVRQRARAS